jgi:hypothetical protein
LLAFNTLVSVTALKKSLIYSWELKKIKQDTTEQTNTIIASRTMTLRGFSSFSKYLDSKNLNALKKKVTKKAMIKMFSIILNKNVKLI